MRSAVVPCGFLLAACLAAAAQQQERCTVEGQVVRAGTGEPLKKVRVVLRKTDARDATYSTSTAESGRFVIPNVQPGRYRLSAERNGYLRMNYGQRRPNQAGTVLTLEPGQRVRDLIINMIPFAVITGRVVDEEGEPLAHVRMMALRATRERGRRELMPSSAGSTDDRGEYRIFGLAPGKYYVSATPSPSPGGISGEGDEEYVQFFYPGVSDPGQAAPLDLQAGAEMNGVDFRLTRMPTVRVRGRVVAAAAGPKLERGIVVFLLPRGGMAASPRNQNTTIDAQGNFEIRGVAPGSYLLTAFQSDRQRRFFARQPIDVGASTIEGITLVLGPGLELTGRVRFDDGAGKLEGLRVLLESVNGNFGGGGGVAPVKPDGTFTFQNLAADEYRFSVLALAEDCYVKAARLGGVDILEHGADLSRGDVPGALDVLLSAAGGHIEGAVFKDNQQAAAGAIVVLVPEGERRNRPDLFRTATADENGHFALRGIPPGDYRLLAWEDVEPGAWFDPDFLREYERRGEALSIGERARHSPQLRMIPAGGPAN